MRRQNAPQIAWIGHGKQETENNIQKKGKILTKKSKKSQTMEKKRKNTFHYLKQ